MSTKYVCVVLFVIFGVIAPILVQCKPLELISDNDEHGAESSFNPNLNTPIPIISQTDISSPDGSFSYRCVIVINIIKFQRFLMEFVL